MRGRRRRQRGLAKSSVTFESRRCGHGNRTGYSSCYHYVTEKISCFDSVSAPLSSRRCQSRFSGSGRHGQPYRQRSFSVAGTYENGNLLFSVATGGNPRLTHLLLEDLQQQYGDDMAAFAAFLDEQREIVKQRLPNPQARQEFWRNTLTNQLLQQVKAGRLQQTKEIIIHAVNRIGAEP